MNSKTVQYKRTLRGSVGAGVGALFNGDGRRYYILEHKSASKYHRAGESQKIIIDQAEMGRSPQCQVRFDSETFPTVSRRHAAIVKDGDGWKIVHLSETNSTLVNGERVETERKLQNGDEIQLSVGGPRMGFITPAGKQGLVSSIRMTERFELFRKQALKPYKRAITALTICLVVAVGGLTTWNLVQKQSFDKQIAEAQSKIKSLLNNDAKHTKLIADGKHQLDSLKNIKPRVITKTIVVNPGETDSEKLKGYEDDVFYMEAFLTVVFKGNEIPLETSKGGYLGWTGTGFLLDDGRFVTAKHCVEGWKFDSDESIIAQGAMLKNEDMMTLFVAGLAGYEGAKLRAHINASSPTKNFQFESDNFTFPYSDEKRVSFGNNSRIRATGDNGTDWAYINTGKKGGIHADAALSSSLPAGVRLEVMGYPRGRKSSEGTCLYGSCQTSGRGLNKGQILISGNNYESGNSGGPVFYNDKGKYKAVGIVSYSIYEKMGGLTPICNLR